MNYVNQLAKISEDGQQSYYPWPIKTLVPNLEERGPGGDISNKSSNALRNVEREQWTTTYDRNHTGMEPRNTRVAS